MSKVFGDSAEALEVNLLVPTRESPKELFSVKESSTLWARSYRGEKHRKFSELEREEKPSCPLLKLTLPMGYQQLRTHIVHCQGSCNGDVQSDFNQLSMKSIFEIASGKHLLVLEGNSWEEVVPKSLPGLFGSYPDVHPHLTFFFKIKEMLIRLRDPWDYIMDLGIANLRFCPVSSSSTTNSLYYYDPYYLALKVSQAALEFEPREFLGMLLTALHLMNSSGWNLKYLRMHGNLKVKSFLGWLEFALGTLISDDDEFSIVDPSAVTLLRLGQLFGDVYVFHAMTKAINPGQPLSGAKQDLRIPLTILAYSGSDILKRTAVNSVDLILHYSIAIQESVQSTYDLITARGPDDFEKYWFIEWSDLKESIKALTGYFRKDIKHGIQLASAATLLFLYVFLPSKFGIDDKYHSLIQIQHTYTPLGSFLGGLSRIGENKARSQSEIFEFDLEDYKMGLLDLAFLSDSESSQQFQTPQG